MQKIKKKIKPLAKRQADEFSNYWKGKCDRLIGELWHNYFSTKVCAVGKSRNHYTDCKGSLQMHHLMKKEHYLYRWDIANMIDLCAYHHDRFSKFSPHSTPEFFMAWLSKEYPEKWKYIQNNKGTITRRHDLPWTFKERYLELIELRKNLERNN